MRNYSLVTKTDQAQATRIFWEINVNKFSLVSILKNVLRDFSISTLSNNINKDFCDIM